MEIFWVDDDIGSFTRPYVEELAESGHKINAFEEPDSALEFFKKHHNKLSCAIIDLMLPTGVTFSADETELGTRTGRSLIEKLQHINSDIPMIILSVVGDREVMLWAKNNKIIYLKKHDTFPRELNSKVNEIILRSVNSC